MSRPVTLRLILLLAIAAASVAGPKIETVEGTRWAVEIVPGEKTKRHEAGHDLKDVITFEGGQVTAPEWNRFGFTPVPYQAEKKGGGRWELRFAQSGPVGQASWTGEIRQGWILGTVVWQHRDGSELIYSFKGKPAK